MDRNLALSTGLLELGLRLDRGAETRLIRFIGILEHWNRSFNLTAITPQEMVPGHLLDSLSVAPFVRGTSLLDVGSGAGLPGIPLAIAYPDWSVVLLESRSKRTQFLVHAVNALDLENVEIVHQRAERYRPQRKFDTLVARAFGPLPKLVAAAGHLCRSSGRILALKGKYPVEEIAETTALGFDVSEVVNLRVPQLTATRHLVIVRPASTKQVGARERRPDKG